MPALLVGPKGEQLVIESSPCNHHWVIESPDGEFSKGICKNCAEERQFRNSLKKFGDPWKGRQGYD